MPADDLTLALRIRADVQQALAGMRNMDRSLGNIDKRGKRADRTMRSMVRAALRLGAAYLGFRAVIGVFRSVIGATEEQAQAVAQVERGLRNLGDQTTLTSAGLQQSAAALQEVTTVGDEATLKLQSLLLTFRKIDDTHFDRVTEAALDMAAALEQGPKDAALQLAKALEDPAQGLTALRRSGTVFSEAQTGVIKRLAETNRLAEAQAIILAEVERQYGGAARAQRETVGGAGAALGNTIGDLLEHRDGAEELRQSIEGLNTTFKDPGVRTAVRGFVDLMVSGFAALVRGADAAVAAVGNLVAAIDPDTLSRGQRVRAFGTSGEGVTPEQLRRDPRLLAEAEAHLARTRETIAQRDAEIARQDSDLFRREQDIAAANRAAAEGAALGLEEVLSGGGAQSLADQAREELNRQQRDLEVQEAAVRRLEEVISLARHSRFAGDRGDRPRRDRTIRPAPPDPAGPSDEEVKAAEAAADKIEAILAASQDRLAQLTLSRIELIAREEAQAVDELRRLGETKGLDAAEVEAAIAAVQKAAAAERHQIHVEGLAADHEALVASLEAGTQAEREAARARAEAHADTVASIEGREVDLGIVGAYEAAIRAANRWRDETLAGLDAAGEGHGALQARVEAVHLAMIESARATAREGVAAGETWIDGMKAALQELGEEGASAADQAREATENAFQGMEDALVAFVTTGKLSFSGFVDSIIADLARIAVRRAITEPLADALFNALPGDADGPAPPSANGANLFGRLQAGVGHAGAIAGQPGGVSRAVPAAIFAAAPRYHSGGIAGLRPDEVPIIAQRGEAVLPRGATLAMPPLEINFHNEGTAQREVRREVRLDPRAIVVDVFTDDWNRRGPIRRTVDRDPPGGAPS